MTEHAAHQPSRLTPDAVPARRPERRLERSPTRPERRHLTWGGIGTATVAALMAGATLVTLITGPPARHAGAQARIVELYVTTDPARPEPGDDVTVKLRAVGCVPGTANFDIYLVNEDGPYTVATRVARAPALTNILWRTRGSVTIDSAIAGWYGARVRCGAFQPRREPMANTFFAVGDGTIPTATTSTTKAVPGDVVTLKGNGCPAREIEYDVIPADNRPSAFRTEGKIAVGADGRWEGQVKIADTSKPGPVSISARCQAKVIDGQPIYILYRSASAIEIGRVANEANAGLEARTTTTAPVTAPPDTRG